MNVGSQDRVQEREKAQVLVQGEYKRLAFEASAWNWLDRAMAAEPPTVEEEAALWNMLLRMRGKVIY